MSSFSAARPFRWAILGAGAIAARFARDLAHVPGHSVAAVFARRPEQAHAWLPTALAARQSLVSAALDAVLAAPLDAVYVATLPDTHHGFARAALLAGHPVLCEKPVTRSLAELDDLLALAGSRNLLFMEAMKTPFLPAYRALRDALGPGPLHSQSAPHAVAGLPAVELPPGFVAGVEALGPVGFVQAGNSSAHTPPGHPSWSLPLAGGALLSIGVYQAFLAVDQLGPAADVQALARFADPPPAVDAFTLVQARHPVGLSQLFAGLELSSPGTATLSGPEGFLVLNRPWWNPSELTLNLREKPSVLYRFPALGDGLHYEAAHFAALVQAGPPDPREPWQSPVVTHAHSRETMRLLDSARSAIGLELGPEPPRIPPR